MKLHQNLEMLLGLIVDTENTMNLVLYRFKYISLSVHLSNVNMYKYMIFENFLLLASFSKKLIQIKKWLNYVLQWNKLI